MKHNKIEKDINNDPPFSIKPIDFELTSGDLSYIKDEMTEYLSDNDIDNYDKQYTEKWLSMIKEISKQYETIYFEENGIHTESYWLDYYIKLITEE